MTLVSFLRRKLVPRTNPARVPDGMRVYAVGDIHGRADLLDQLLTLLGEDAAKAVGMSIQLVFLGDYVDRGWESRAVLERLSTLHLEGIGVTFLKGNHEEAILTFLDDPSFLDSWRQYGGLETLHSYGIKDLTFRPEDEYFHSVHAEFSKALPEQHLVFLRRLSLTHDVGDYFFAHAGVRPGVALAEQSPRDLCWIRDEFLKSEADFGKRVVHGHCPEEEPQVRKNRIGIDTGAYITGCLTAVVLEGAEVRFLRTGT